jgi:hypothetical protein
MQRRIHRGTCGTAATWPLAARDALEAFLEEVEYDRILLR